MLSNLSCSNLFSAFACCSICSISISLYWVTSSCSFLAVSRTFCTASILIFSSSEDNSSVLPMVAVSEVAVVSSARSKLVLVVIWEEGEVLYRIVC